MSDLNTWEKHNWADLPFAAFVERHSHYLNVVLLTAYQDGDRVRYQRKDAPSSPTFEDDPNKAEFVLEGSIKWDGCANWIMMQSHAGVCEHYCGFYNFMQFTEAVRRLYVLASELESADFGAPAPLGGAS